MSKKFDFKLTITQATGTEAPLLVDVAEDVEWTDGPDGKRRPGQRIGTRYTVLMLQNACAPLVVKTPELTSVVSADEVAAACLSGQFVRVRFENFSATPYQSKNGLGVSGTADRCVVAPSPAPSAPKN